MGTTEIIIKILIFALVIGGLVAAMPYLVVKLTKPGWALQKTILESILVGTIIQGVLTSINQPFLPAVVTTIYGIFRYKSRVKKYKELENSNEASENI